MRGEISRMDGCMDGGLHAHVTLYAFTFRALGYDGATCACEIQKTTRTRQKQK